jgi:hypothetical protein
MIALLAGVVRWIARHLLALILIALVLYFGKLLVGEWRKSTLEVTAARNSLSGLAASLDDLQRFANQSAVELNQRVNALRQSAGSEIDNRRKSVDSRLTALKIEDVRRTPAAMTISLVAGRQEEIVDDYRRKLEIKLLELELEHLNLLDRERTLEALRSQHARAYAALAATTPGLKPICPRDLESWRVRLSAFVSKDALRHLELCKENMAAYTAFKQQKDRFGSLTKLSSADEEATEVLRPIEAQLEKAKVATARKSFGAVLHDIAAHLPTALGILLLALLTPLAIKTFLFYVIAPIASRRPPIRILPPTAGAGHPPLLFGESGSVSSVSRTICVSPDQELLVHSDYVQSSSTGGNKSTKWLLHAGYPLASLAAGMTVLTRVRPTTSESVVVSATTDPFSEVGVLDLREGDALVLQPHNLVGVLQLRNLPVRITSHWRLGSLTAWLTLQLRYLVFHGPGSLIVKGCRGIRIEPAGTGRMINQAATMGFSANLAYSATRTETFVAYLLGKQELFNDQFSGGPGFYVYEEMPHFGKKSGVAGKGFEGLLDSILKIFGI